MILGLIASVARDGAIGRGNDLLWRDPADLRHLRTTTMGCPVLMGRRTWESLPPKFRPLPGRRNVVLTRQHGYAAGGAEIAADLDAALARVAEAPRVWVLGGADLYAQALPRADELVLTEIDATFDGADAHFPAWRRDDWKEVERRPGTGDDGTRYAIVTYRRRRAAG